MTQNIRALTSVCHRDVRQMRQTMTGDARQIIAAFTRTPVMTLLAVTTMTGLSRYAARFIPEQMLLSGMVMVSNGNWRVTDGFRAYIRDMQAARGEDNTARHDPRHPEVSPS